MPSRDDRGDSTSDTELPCAHAPGWQRERTDAAEAYSRLASLLVRSARGYRGPTGASRATLPVEATSWPPAAVSLLLAAAATSPALAGAPPPEAERVRLDLLRLLAPVARVSLWRRGSGGSVAVVASVGGLPSPRQAREVAERALRGETCSRGGRVHAAAAGGSAAIVFDCAPADLERVLPLAERLAVVAVSVDPADEERDEGDRDVGDELVRRIGADLHDGPLQTLALAAGTLQAAQRRLEPGAPGARTAAAELRRAATLVDRAAAELRRISCGAVGVAESMALPALLHDEVEAFREQTRLDVHLVIQGPVERLERAQAEAILRIAQEALANVRAHAGARRVEVVLVVGDDLSWLDVVDDGRGFDVGRATARAAHERRLGLSGMTTRAKRSGGAIEVRSSPGGGSRIAVTLPTRGARLSGRRGRRDAGGANGPA